MYVSIRSVNAENDEGPYSFRGGKSSRVKSLTFEVISRGDDLLIQAECSEDSSTGKRGGATKTIIRRVVINLDANDLKRIMDVAIQARLVTVPGSRDVAEAIQLLEKALSDMGVRR